jgi:hypothetical protein
MMPCWCLEQSSRSHLLASAFLLFGERAAAIEAADRRKFLLSACPYGVKTWSVGSKSGRGRCENITAASQVKSLHGLVIPV